MCGGEESLDPGYDRQEQTAASENCGSGGGKEGIFYGLILKHFFIF